MKKVLMSASMVALLVAFASCNGNKANGADSDSIVAVEIVEDTVMVDTATGDTTVVVEDAEDAAPVAKKSTKKGGTKTPEVVNRPEKVSNNAEVKASDAEVKSTVTNTKVQSAVNAAVSKTKEVAEKGVSDANEKAKNWKDKKKKNTEN